MTVDAQPDTIVFQLTTSLIAVSLNTFRACILQFPALPYIPTKAFLNPDMHVQITSLL
jgi:hypothetical protein